MLEAVRAVRGVARAFIDRAGEVPQCKSNRSQKRPAMG